MKKESVKKHESGKCNCRKVMNTTNRLCRACMVPGTRESGDLAMQKRFFISNSGETKCGIVKNKK
jgi:hypothetical protein